MGGSSRLLALLVALLLSVMGMAGTAAADQPYELCSGSTSKGGRTWVYRVVGFRDARIGIQFGSGSGPYRLSILSTHSPIRDRQRVLSNAWHTLTLRTNDDQITVATPTYGLLLNMPCQIDYPHLKRDNSSPLPYPPSWTWPLLQGTRQDGFGVAPASYGWGGAGTSSAAGWSSAAAAVPFEWSASSPAAAAWLAGVRGGPTGG